MTRLALRNPLAVLLLSLVVLVFAAVVVPRMSVDTFPELSPPVLVVGTQAPGLGAKDVEKTLSWRIEKYVSATPGVDHVESISRNNLSIVFVWFAWGTDLNAAQTLVQQQVAFAMAAVPKSLGVLPPFVLQYDPSNAPVVQVTVSGGGLTGPQLYDYAMNQVEPLLEGIPGVASASVNGGRQRQINVRVDPVKAQAHGVTAGDVAAAISNANALLPSGKFIQPGFDANVYTNAVPARLQALGEAVVKSVAGRPVLVRDVALLEDGGAPETQAVAVDGKDAVYLSVLRTPGGNTLQIVDAVKAKLANLPNKLPGLEVKPVFDQSTFVRTTSHGLQTEILRAMFLIGLVILFFLQSARSVAVAATAIPISFAIILIVLYLTGQTLNAFTLGGLTLAMGPLVDISVVVLEAVHREQHAGKSLTRAALDGARSVAMPTLAASITTIVVLLPVLLLTGLAKKLFAPLAITVATAMIAGYLVSMLVTPVACRYLLGPNHHPGKLAHAVHHKVRQLIDVYDHALQAVLPYRWLLMACVAALVAVAGATAARLPATFFPEIDESMERVLVRFAPGTSLESANQKLNAMGAMLRKELSEGAVDVVLTNVGAPGAARSAMSSPNVGPHMGFIRLSLKDAEHRHNSQRELADRARRLLTQHFPGVELLQAPGGLVASVFSNGYSAPIVVELRGDNLDELGAQAQAVMEVARGVPGVRDVWPTLELAYPEVHVDTDRQTAGMVGVTARAAAQTTLEATLGNINTPGVWVDAGNGQAYYVVTQYQGDAIRDPASLGQVPVAVHTGGNAVPLGAYAQVRRSLGPVQVERNQLQRAAHVMMQTEGRDIGSAAADLEQRLKSDKRTRAIPFQFVGQVQLMRTTFGGLGGALGLAVLLVFVIMATQFKSARLPLVMLLTVPVALVGIVLALLAAGQGFSVTALMGALMVVGIAVSNGILLVDHANGRLKQGADVHRAMRDAARARLVPILMTSLATMAGLLPTALALEAGTEANQPLALAVVGGLASSTLISLFVVPAMFTVLARRAKPEDPELQGEPAAVLTA